MRFTRAEMDVGESLPWNWDFSNEDVFAADPITSATMTDWQGATVGSGLTIGSPAYSNPIVQTQITANTLGTYFLRLLAQNNRGDKRAGHLELTVRRPTPDA